MVPFSPHSLISLSPIKTVRTWTQVTEKAVYDWKKKKSKQVANGKHCVTFLFHFYSKDWLYSIYTHKFYSNLRNYWATKILFLGFKSVDRVCLTENMCVADMSFIEVTDKLGTNYDCLIGLAISGSSPISPLATSIPTVSLRILNSNDNKMVF